VIAEVESHIHEGRLTFARSIQSPEFKVKLLTDWIHTQLSISCYHFGCMKKPPAQVDFIVVGAGVAGLRAAIALAEAGKVLVLAKQELTESATQYAQGGIAVALSDEDEISLHLQDTINAGDGLVNVNAARVLVEEGPDRIQELIDWGTQFDRKGTRLAFTREAAHSRDRILHAHGDSTGREIGRALYAKAITLKNISFSAFEFTASLLVEGGRICGVKLISGKGELQTVHCGAVLLATGGAGHVYSNTTNPAVATADGIAMAFRAGAEISDMEFVQFHPTALYVKNAPRFLLSEALRGEGAVLRNAELHRFMPKYHKAGEMAPRDVVARAIAHELEVCRLKDPVVYLDLTHLKPEHIKARFPRIYETCLKHNVDITVDQVPVRPAAHYLMGGIRSDLQGRSSLPGLYAAGEAACTGVHGANRLASNSLLEGLVFGARAGHTMRQEMKHAGKPAMGETEQPGVGPATNDVENFIRSIQQLMWNKVGIVRSREGLTEALQDLQTSAQELPLPTSRRNCEARNIHTAAQLITRSALARLESRGAHYRTDYPEHDDARFKKHSIVGEKGVRFV
jgi:L-aspartate oxidase